MNRDDILEQVKHLRSEEGWLYAGLPTFKALFGRDSVISSLQLMHEFPDIGISTVNKLIELQGKYESPETMEEPGKIIHEYQIDKALVEERSRKIPWLRAGKNYFSVDSTPLFCILASRLICNASIGYEEKEKIADSIAKSLDWMINRGMGNSFLHYKIPEAGKGLQSQCWRDGSGAFLDSLVSPVSVVGVQGYAYMAIQESVSALQKYQDNEEKYHDLVEISMNKAQWLRENVTAKFRLPGETYLGLAIDGSGRLLRSVTTDPGHLIMSGLLSRLEERDIIERLFDPDMMTDYGIRTLSMLDRNFDSHEYQRGSIWPHDNWIIAYGMKLRGYQKQYDDIRSRILNAAEKLGGLPEYYSVDFDGKLVPQENLRVKPCFPQAWSSGAHLYFIDNPQ
ncbi:MAG: hypothetical protein M1315_01865 [Candidatus Thermoplasmatota archaeon]|nr:hypothetical protein [Candidatus Thermoplasmatota archaeon]